jgi:precorrin-6B methylase 2
MTTHPAHIVARLLEAAWAASALARLIEGGPDRSLAADDPSVRLLEPAGLLERQGDGFVLVGRDELRGYEGAVVANIRSVLGQAYNVALGSSGWSSQDDEVLAAQGEASAAGGVGFANLIESLPGLADVFAAGGTLLDVGVGVAGLACAFCEAVPHSKAIGLDVEPRALKLARQRVRDAGLDDRIDLREVSIEDFDRDGVADLAHMSPVFIPPSVLPAALKRIHAALKPGGWLVLSGIVSEHGDASTRWMAHQAGGSALTTSAAATLAAEAGFGEPIEPPLPPGAPRIRVFQRA